MAASILQEYLVKIGYQTDAMSYHKFSQNLDGVTGKVFKLGLAIGTIGIATAAATLKFSNNMSKLYFESQMAGTSAKNLEALGFAFKRIGLDSEDAKATLGEMYEFIQKQNGAVAITGLTGIATEGRETIDILLDVIDKLNSLPDQTVAKNWAESLKIPYDLMNLSYKHPGILREAFNEAKKTQNSQGLNEAKYMEIMANSLQLQRDWDTLLLKTNNFSILFFNNFVKPLDKVLVYLNYLMDNLAHLLNGDISKVINNIGKDLKTDEPWKISLVPFQYSPVSNYLTMDNLFHLLNGDISKAINNKVKGLETDEYWKGIRHIFDEVELTFASKTWTSKPDKANVGDPNLPPPANLDSLQDYFNKVDEVSKKLAGGASLYLDKLRELAKRILLVESNGKPNVVGTSGEVGLMQLMLGTAVGYGVKDRRDPSENIRGGVEYLDHLLKKYKNEDVAIAAYNSGETKMDRWLSSTTDRFKPISKMPSSDYVNSVRGKKLITPQSRNNNTNINITNNVNVANGNEKDVRNGVESANEMLIEQMKRVNRNLNAALN